MPPRTLASLAHALAAASDLDAALLGLAESLADLDRFAQLALVEHDARRAMLCGVARVEAGALMRAPLETTIDHLPSRERAAVSAGGQLVDFGDRADDFAPLLGFPPIAEGGWLAVRGIRFEGELAALVALYEPRKFFGTRTAERFAAAVSVFELALVRFLERDARAEAVRTLEEVTHRVHSEYDRKLAALEVQLHAVSANSGGAHPDDDERTVRLERELSQAVEDARRARARTAAVETQVVASVEQLERAHIELHRRSETLRQRTRTLYLLERVLQLDNGADDPARLVDGLLSLVGDDLHAQRCSLMLRAPEPDTLFLAAARGIAPGVPPGYKVRVGTGVAGRVAATRVPLLVQDVTEASPHPFLQDHYFTTGSFISFPLVYHDQLVGVVNLANRARQGVFLEDDVERVKLLALVISLVAHRARLADRLAEALGVS